MALLLSALGVVLGTALAYRAKNYSKHQAIIEAIAGWMIIGGFGLLGFLLGCAFIL